MKTKRVNDEFHRLDVKLPMGVYEQVSEIAVNSFDAKIHHISNKPEITPTLLYLLELGIESFSNGNELSKKPNTDNYTDTIPITDNEVKELIKNALIPMHERLNDLVTVQSQVDELKTILYRLTNTDNKPIKPDNVAVAMSEDLTNTLAVELINNTDNLTDNDTDTIKEDITEYITLSESPNLLINEVSPQIVPIAEKQENKLNKRESEVLGAMSNVGQGTVFDSQSKLLQFLGFDKSDSAVVTKLKPFWENKLFSVKPVGSSNELTRL